MPTVKIEFHVKVAGGDAEVEVLREADDGIDRRRVRETEERLVAFLLADASKVRTAAAFLAPHRVETPSLSQILAAIYAVQAAGKIADWGTVRWRFRRDSAVWHEVERLWKLGDRLAGDDPGEYRSRFFNILEEVLDAHPSDAHARAATPAAGRGVRHHQSGRPAPAPAESDRCPF